MNGTPLACKKIEIVQSSFHWGGKEKPKDGREKFLKKSAKQKVAEKSRKSKSKFCRLNLNIFITKIF